MENKQIIELYNLIEKEIMPFGFYYNYKSNIISSNLNFENDKQMRNFIEIKIKSNNENFINDLNIKNDIDFIKELNIHFAFYNKQTSDMTLWLSHTERLIKKKINDRYLRYAFDNWLKEIQSLSQPQPQNSLPITEENKKNNEPIDFDDNNWNLNTYNLFNYYIEYYKNDKKVKYINIYYFLKKFCDTNNSEYRFTFIIKDYKKFILKKYKVELKKFETSEYKFDETEVPKLKDLLKKHKALLK